MDQTISPSEQQTPLEKYLRGALEAAFNEASQQPLEPWDIEATIAEAHRRHASS